MRMREIIDLIEAGYNHPLMSREPLPNTGSPADRFISAVEDKFPREVHCEKLGPISVKVNDGMQGVRTRQNWETIKVLTRLAREYGVKINVQGSTGRRF